MGPWFNTIEKHANFTSVQCKNRSKVSMVVYIVHYFKWSSHCMCICLHFCVYRMALEGIHFIALLLHTESVDDTKQRDFLWLQLIVMIFCDFYLIYQLLCKYVCCGKYLLVVIHLRIRTLNNWFVFFKSNR